MVLAMAVIGAVTRLTESGLSIVEWRPLMGVLPPLTEGEWRRVFDLYTQSPEYAQEHYWMELSDFKKIFFWEWLHRFWGRMIGLVYAIPLCVFWIRGHIPSGLHRRLVLLLILGGGQGMMGWYMVQSGLIDIPAVSHYRLAAHLMLAVLVFSGLIWTILDFKTAPVQCKGMYHGGISLILLLLTIMWGAFVAGLDGGMIYNTWPLMGDTLIPEEAVYFYNNPAGAQFVHRWIAMIAGVSILTFALRLKSWSLLAMVCLQIGLGISTLILQVPIALATLHQAGAFILLALLLKNIHKTMQKSL